MRAVFVGVTPCPAHMTDTAVITCSRRLLPDRASDLLFRNGEIRDRLVAPPCWIRCDPSPTCMVHMEPQAPSRGRFLQEEFVQGCAVEDENAHYCGLYDVVMTDKSSRRVDRQLESINDH